MLKYTRPPALALLVIQLLCGIPSNAPAQTAGEKAPVTQDKPLKLRTDEVIVDAVVLDKRNHSVTDLTTDDIELYEDGVKQKITSFRFESSAAE